MAAVSRRLPAVRPTNALAPALGSDSMKDSAKLFVLFPAKISYAGWQGAENPLRHAGLIAIGLIEGYRESYLTLSS